MGYDFWTTSTHTARKMHQCDANCGQPIMPGETYQKHAGVWEGDFSACKRHEDCAALAEEVRDAFDPYNEGMRFDLLDEFSDEPNAARAELDRVRGFFPRAVCRFEFRMRNWTS